ncbi:CBS domain-containing protein [Methanosarcinales archaeon ex4572_44]|nr:MAG: CBS domain-containing protein [Methanosarcinales archaeon ex4572_44]RLG25627.1 MAG: CBS domain-containing protein [Methanosarcinales archaeon]
MFVIWHQWCLVRGDMMVLNDQNFPMHRSGDAYRDLGSLDFKSRISDRKGDVMTIASQEVVMVPPTTTIMGAARTMRDYNIRRLPIADAGTHRLQGIVTSLDIADFMGGGLRHNLLEHRFHGNLLSAVNESVREIMEENVISLSEKSSLKDALHTMIEKKIGGVPIVDDDERVKAVISEQDFVWLLGGVTTGKIVEDWMSKEVVSIAPDLPIGEVTNSMITHGFRRFPIIRDGVLFGLITASDVLRYLANGEIFNKLVSSDAEEALHVHAKELIGKEVVTATPAMDLGEAADLMIEHKIGSLPVVDGETLVGIITERDFIKSLI